MEKGICSASACSRGGGTPTDRAVRGSPLGAKLDGIYGAEQRGESHHTRTRAEAVAQELLNGDLREGQGRGRLLETRKEVQRGWFAVSDNLEAQGQEELARRTRRFVDEMPPVDGTRA